MCVCAREIIFITNKMNLYFHFICIEQTNYDQVNSSTISFSMCGFQCKQYKDRSSDFVSHITHTHADRMRKGVKKCAQTHDTGEDLYVSKHIKLELDEERLK